MTAYRKCLGSKECPRLSEFRLYIEPVLIPVGGDQYAGAFVETYLCAHHMRVQMRKLHEDGGSMLIDRV